MFVNFLMIFREGMFVKHFYELKVQTGILAVPRLNDVSNLQPSEMCLNINTVSTLQDVHKTKIRCKCRRTRNHHL